MKNTGVVTGYQVQELVANAKANQFALPGANTIGTNAVNAVFETCRGYFAIHLDFGAQIVQSSTSVPDDKHWTKERHLTACFISKIKHYRRIFSRFEKLVKRYLGFLSFAGALI